VKYLKHHPALLFSATLFHNSLAERSLWVNARSDAIRTSDIDVLHEHMSSYLNKVLSFVGVPTRPEATNRTRLLFEHLEHPLIGVTQSDRLS
jgi:hypothetical protein